MEARSSTELGDYDIYLRDAHAMVSMFSYLMNFRILRTSENSFEDLYINQFNVLFFRNNSDLFCTKYKAPFLLFIMPIQRSQPAFKKEIMTIKIIHGRSCMNLVNQIFIYDVSTL